MEHGLVSREQMESQRRLARGEEPQQSPVEEFVARAEERFEETVRTIHGNIQNSSPELLIEMMGVLRGEFYAGQGILLDYLKLLCRDDYQHETARRLFQDVQGKQWRTMNAIARSYWMRAQATDRAEEKA